MDPFTTFHPGERLQISADLHRMLVRMAQKELSARGDQKAGPVHASADLSVLFKNVTGGSLDQCSIVAIGNKLIVPDTSATFHLGNTAFETASPDPALPFAILQAPALASGLARGLLDDISFARVSYSSTAHTFANAATGDYVKLASATGGPARILWSRLPAATSLNGNINNSVTTIVVNSATDFPDPAILGNFVITIGAEDMTVTAISGTSWTVTRAANGTTAASHTNGNTVSFKTGTVWALVDLLGAADVAGSIITSPATGTAAGPYYTFALTTGNAISASGSTVQFPKGSIAGDASGANGPGYLFTGKSSNQAYSAGTKAVYIEGDGVATIDFSLREAGADASTFTNAVSGIISTSTQRMIGLKYFRDGVVAGGGGVSAGFTSFDTGGAHSWFIGTATYGLWQQALTFTMEARLYQNRYTGFVAGPVNPGLALYQDSTYVSSGAWSSVTAYVGGELVTYGGLVYEASGPGTNHQPDISPTFWTQVEIRPCYSVILTDGGVTPNNGVYGTTAGGDAVTGGIITSLGTGSSALVTVGTITSGTWNGSTIDIAHGGTAKTSFTAYAVICGGTTSTGALQSIASVGSAGQVLTSNGAGALPTFQAAGGGSMAIGSAVTSGTANYVLFVDGSGNLGQSADIQKGTRGIVLADASGNATICNSAQAGNFTNSTQSVNLCDYASNTAGIFSDGTRTVDICNGAKALAATDGTHTLDICKSSYALQAGDGTRTVRLCDGTNNITYSPGTPSDWNGAAPTDVWVGLDRCAALLKALNGGTGP